MRPKRHVGQRHVCSCQSCYAELKGDIALHLVCQMKMKTVVRDARSVNQVAGEAVGQVAGGRTAGQVAPSGDGAGGWTRFGQAGGAGAASTMD